MVPVQKSKTSQTQKDNIRKQRARNSRFSSASIGEGGPINNVLTCSHVSRAFTDHYDAINWSTKEDKK